MSFSRLILSFVLCCTSTIALASSLIVTNNSPQILNVIVNGGPTSVRTVTAMPNSNQSANANWIGPQTLITAPGASYNYRLTDIALYSKANDAYLIIYSPSIPSSGAYNGWLSAETAIQAVQLTAPDIAASFTPVRNAGNFGSNAGNTSNNYSNQFKPANPVAPPQKVATKQLSGHAFVIKNNSSKYLNAKTISKPIPGKVGFFSATPPKRNQWMEPVFDNSKGSNIGSGWYFEALGSDKYRMYALAGSKRKYLSVSSAAASQFNSSPGTSSVAVMVDVYRLNDTADGAAVLQLVSTEGSSNSTVIIDGVRQGISGSLSKLLQNTSWTTVQ